MSKPIDINTYDQRLIYDLELPMPNWRWVGKIQGPEALNHIDWDALLIESITLPNGEVVNQSPSFGGGKTTYYPDFPEVSTITLGVYETEKGAANLALTRWQEAVKTRDGWFGLPANYKCSLQLNMFGYSSNTEHVMGYSAEGVWPIDGGSLDLNYTDDGRVVLQINCSCDRIFKSPRVLK